MAGRRSEWTDSDRAEFWSVVRAYMARRSIEQAPMAEALHLSRSGVTRRLNGRIKERPEPQLVAGIIAVLEPDAGDAAKLRALAGGTIEPVISPTAAEPAPPP